jgi:hypothetical protein
MHSINQNWPIFEYLTVIKNVEIHVGDIHFDHHTCLDTNDHPKKDTFDHQIILKILCCSII